MPSYVALLRGVNVGGKNMVKMADLKAAFEEAGFRNVSAYINSGNILFESERDEAAIQAICTTLLVQKFSLDVPACVIASIDLTDALSHAPPWWGNTANTKHDAFFVIPPTTAEQIVDHVGAVREDYEKLAYHGRVVFWSAPAATFSRTRVSQITKNRAMYRSITVRNANTAFKLAELVRERMNER